MQKQNRTHKSIHHQNQLKMTQRTIIRQLNQVAAKQAQMDPAIDYGKVHHQRHRCHQMHSLHYIRISHKSQMN